VLEHQPLLVAEMPDRAVDQFLQRRRQVRGGFAGGSGAVEFVEQRDQEAVIVVDLGHADAEDAAPDDVLHVALPWRTFVPL
jgi:hypothetical protein